MRRVAARALPGTPWAVITVAVAALVVGACGTPGPPSSTGPSSTAPSASTVSPTPTPTPAPTGSPTPSGTHSTPGPSATSASPSHGTTSKPTASPSGVPAWLAGQDVRRIPTTRKVVALTFDGGANAAGLDRILRTLAAENVPATFFLTGRWVERYPAGARAVVAAGHVVGNHTTTHVHSTRVTDAELTAEVLGAARTIRATTGADPRPWFRFPYGERTSADIRLLNGLGYVCVSWTVDTLGWLGTSRGTASDVRDRVVESAVPGMIVLMHVGSNPDDGSTFDADALPSTIAALRARGYSFVTVTALLAR